MKTVAAFLFLVFVLPATAQEPAPRLKAVPFDLLKTKHIVVNAKVNGKGPYRLIFDTGAPISLINNKVARESGMIAKNAPKPLLPLFGSMGPAKIKNLEVGELKAPDVNAVVMDHPTLEAISKVLGPIEGIVGFPFFARYKMTIDYQAKEMTFVPNGYDPPDAMEAMMGTILALADDTPQKKVLVPGAQWGLVLHKDEGDEDEGVVVKEVLAGSAAAEAGLKAGDRLVTLDGRWTDSIAEAFTAAAQVKAGQSAKVVVKRDDKQMEIVIKPRRGV